jgi:acyl-CoA synthetase (AMP-forming)/AMP-acid ligase II/thioesterase domain-containing protein
VAESKDNGSVWNRVRQRAEVAPWAPALIEPGGSWWDYGTLQRLVEDLAAVLRGTGLGEDDTVAVVLPDGACGLVTLLGTMSVCGCAPLNPALTEVELRHDLEELGVKALMCAPGYGLGMTLGKELGLAVIHVTSKEHGCEWKQVRTGHEQTGRSNGGAVLLLHTSATTGRRKVVPLTRSNLEAMTGNTMRAMRLGKDDRLLLLARLFHAQGILSTVAQWRAGGAVIATRGLEPGAFAGWLNELKPTWYTSGPTVHRAILAELRTRPASLPGSLRMVRSGGNTLPVELKRELEQTLGVPVLDMYGLSEAGGVAATELDRPAESSGRWKSMGPEIAVMDGGGRLVAAGVEGEIVVRGPSVMGGYLNDEAANREAFRDGWFRTGDLGRLDSDGTLTMSGRLKEMINRGGQKVHPAEIDEVLSVHRSVREVAAFGVPHGALGEDVACAVVLRDGAQASEAELRAFARKSLALYKVPRRVYVVSEIPHGATGKPQRLALRERFALAEPDVAGIGETAVERRLNDVDGALKEIWMRRLGCPTVRPQHDFFQLGGDSIEAESMLAEVETLLDIELGVEANERFFEHPTLGTLTQIVSMPVAPDKVRSHEIGLHHLRGDGPGLEAFLIPADGDEGWYYRLLSRYMGHDRRMAIVRPENSWHPPALEVVERAAVLTAAAIRQARPRGPYLILGYCSGGVFAYETARRLEQEGETVLLVLFDAPMPGAPHFVYEWRRYAEQLGELVVEARRTRRWRPVASFGRWWLQRLLWLGVRRYKRSLRRFEGRPLMGWIHEQSRCSYFPHYRVPQSRLPILHFVGAQEQGEVREGARRAWAARTRGEVTVATLPGTHNTMFSEANLKPMSEAIEAWVEARVPKPVDMMEGVGTGRD